MFRLSFYRYADFRRIVRKTCATGVDKSISPTSNSNQTIGRLKPYPFPFNGRHRRFTTAVPVTGKSFCETRRSEPPFWILRDETILSPHETTKEFVLAVFFSKKHLNSSRFSKINSPRLHQPTPRRGLSPAYSVVSTIRLGQSPRRVVAEFQSITNGPLSKQSYRCRLHVNSLRDLNHSYRHVSATASTSTSVMARTVPGRATVGDVWKSRLSPKTVSFQVHVHVNHSSSGHLPESGLTTFIFFFLKIVSRPNDPAK